MNYVRSVIVKIVYISDLAPPQGIGGAENVMFSEAAEMSKRGHEVHILTLGRLMKDSAYDQPNKRDKNLYIHFLGLGLFDIYSSPNIMNKTAIQALGLFNPLFAKRLKKIVSKIKPDIVHSHYVYRISYGAVSSAVSNGIPWVHTFHDYLFECPKGSLLRSSNSICLDHPFYCRARNDIFKEAFGHPDRIVGISRYICNRLLDSGFRQDRISHIPNPLRMQAGTFDISYDPFLLFVGRLESCKGIDEFAERISDRLDNGQMLRIVGTGPLSNRIKEIASGSNGKILPMGRVSDDELNRLYSSCRTVIFPSKWPEVAPLVPQEAMAFGKPVIATDIGGTADFIRDGENGYLIQIQDFQSLIDKSLLLLHDEELARRFGKQGRLMVNDLSASNHGDRLLALYDTLLSK